MKFKYTMACIAAFLCLTATTAQANLILHVSEALGGNTRWQFSGSAVIGTTGGSNSFWGENSGSLVNLNALSHAIISGSGNIGSTSDPLNAIINSWASTHIFDGLSVRTNSITWNAGDTLFWSGDIITGSPFANLNLGTISTQSLISGQTLRQGNLIVTVADGPLDVPEPASLALLGLGLAGFSYARRKAG